MRTILTYDSQLHTDVVEYGYFHCRPLRFWRKYFLTVLPSISSEEIRKETTIVEEREGNV